MFETFAGASSEILVRTWVFTGIAFIVGIVLVGNVAGMADRFQVFMAQIVPGAGSRPRPRWHIRVVGGFMLAASLISVVIELNTIFG
ncbi:hypothetical protein GA0115245_14584 [Streptomyces sp. di188]|nr:hypothetical protein GA0115238_10584 [Streptomyces sp. di50b]SCE52874.1 hypothetical protein GA0115245_14584 [Streptomyces sp. di188]